MAMRETVGSLRAYFILVGAVGAVRSIAAITGGPNAAVVKVGAGVDLALALAFLAAGFALPKLLRDSPGLVKGLIYATAVMQVVIAVALFAATRDPVVLVAPAIVLLIAWYLLVNVNRLSAAEKPPEKNK
jgi:hypothetical protein